jgi:hypothetical protein
MHEPREAIRSTDRTEALTQTSYGRHVHRGRHRRQHGRDDRVPVGRVRDRMVH